MTRRHVSQLLPVLIFTLIVGVLFIPFFASGYILTLDMTFTDTLLSPPSTNSNYIYWLFLHLVHIILPVDVIQKFLLTGGLVAAALGAFKLFTYVTKASSPTYGAYFAGLLCIFNPFVYSRFMSGQYLVLLGFALLPFFILVLLKLLDEPSWKRAAWLAILLAITGFVSIHTLGMCLLVALPLVALYGYRHRHNANEVKSLVAKLSGAAALFVVLSSNWIIPVLTGHSRTSETVGSFDASDFTAFATGGDNLGVIGNVLAMQGFWADTANLYLIPQDVYVWWWVPIVLLWLLVGIGFYAGWRTQRGLTVAFGCMLVLAVVLAAGTSGSIFAPFNEWLVAHVPLFAGYREPQKFVAVVVLVYAVFAALGLEQLALWLKKRQDTRQFIPLVAIATYSISLACAPLMLWGFNGQLKVSHYPSDWYAMNRYFEQAIPPDTQILTLPWHMYMRFDFAGRVISNPMDRFFTPDLIISNNPEFGNTKSHLSTAAQSDLQARILPDAPYRDDLGAQLARHNISYVLLAKEYDDAQYGYLDAQRDLELVKDTDNLKLYKVKSATIESGR